MSSRIIAGAVVQHSDAEPYIRELEEEFIRMQEDHQITMRRLYAFYIALLSIFVGIAIHYGISPYDALIMCIQSTIIGFAPSYIAGWLFPLYQAYVSHRKRILHGKV